MPRQIMPGLPKPRDLGMRKREPGSAWTRHRPALPAARCAFDRSTGRTTLSRRLVVVSVGTKRPHSLEPMDIVRARNITRHTIVADRVEVAATSETRRRGLLGRTGLEAGSGLWLVPCEWVHMFGMKFAIDIVVLDKNNVVVGAQEGLKPGWIGKLFWGAHSTLELPLGAIRTSRTAKGDRIEWEEHTAE